MVNLVTISTYFFTSIIWFTNLIRIHYLARLYSYILSHDYCMFLCCSLFIQFTFVTYLPLAQDLSPFNATVVTYINHYEPPEAGLLKRKWISFSLGWNIVLLHCPQFRGKQFAGGFSQPTTAFQGVDTLPRGVEGIVTMGGNPKCGYSGI